MNKSAEQADQVKAAVFALSFRETRDYKRAWLEAEEAAEAFLDADDYFKSDEWLAYVAECERQRKESRRRG